MTDPSLTIVNSHDKNDLGRIRLSKIGYGLVKYGQTWQKTEKSVFVYGKC